MRNSIKIIDGITLPEILNLIISGNVTDSEAEIVDIETTFITNGDIIIHPVLNQVNNSIIDCLKFGLDNKILSEEPEEFESEVLQFNVYKYDKTEKTLLTFDLWECLNANNFIDKNFEFIIDLDSEQPKNETNIALINNWSVWYWK